MISNKILAKIDNNRQRYVNELLEFLKIPSVSTCPANVNEVRHAAQWVFEHLKNLGFEADIHETSGHPLVLGRHCKLNQGPTLLIYGHYDVQPPEPLDEWQTPPFEPTIQNGYVHARGATDDKGQFFTYLKAIEAILAVEGRLPINIKVLVEGEEEIGSPNLAPFLKHNKGMLKADVLAISDTSQLRQGVPAINYGLRGLVYFDIKIQGPGFDLHSGYFGGIVANPAQGLVEILAKLKRSDGTVAIPGFYDDVLPLEEWERTAMNALQHDDQELREYLGVPTLTGEHGYGTLERKTARPTLDVNGIWGGFAGDGAKTIIPAKAGAKVSMRLVPNQTSTAISRLFRAYLESLVPPGLEMKVTELSGADPVMVSLDRRAIQAACRAVSIGFGKHPVFIREGGSIPIVNSLKDELGIDDVLLLGWGSPDDGAHSPNERFCLDDFHRGIRSAAALFYEIASC